MPVYSGVTDWGARGVQPAGKLNLKPGPHLAEISVLSILLIFSRLLFLRFFRCFRFLAGIDIHDIRIHYYFVTFFECVG